MPERPDEHKIGARAVAAVDKLLKERGFAVDQISEDYGEDLLVQTDHEGRMDASRLWVQVKGTADVERHRTSKKSKKERFSYSVPMGHAMRWIRTIDLVIVVLWDVERDTGWYAVPRRQIDEWQCKMSGQKEVTLHFGKSSETEPGPVAKGVFSPETLSRLAWESRFEHFRLLALSTLDVRREREGAPSIEGAESQRLALIMDEFLRLLGLVDPDHSDPTELMVKEEVRERIKELYEALIYGEMGEPPEDVGDQLRLVAARVILERIAEIDPMLGMPSALLGYTAHALALSVGLARFYAGEQPAGPRRSRR